MENRSCQINLNVFLARFWDIKITALTSVNLRITCHSLRYLKHTLFNKIIIIIYSIFSILFLYIDSKLGSLGFIWISLCSGMGRKVHREKSFSALMPMPVSVKEIFSCQVASAPLQPLWSLLYWLWAKKWRVVAASFLWTFLLIQFVSKVFKEYLWDINRAYWWELLSLY